MEKPSYYSILTADVRYDKGLKPNEKLLFSEVTALSNKSGYCHAGNKYFADLYGVTKQTVSVWVNHLKKSGYVQIEIIKDGNRIKERRIYPTSTPIKKNLNTYKEKDDGGIKKNLNTPIKKNLKENITSINNTRVNNSSSSAFDLLREIGVRLNGITTPVFLDYINRLGDDLVKYAVESMAAIGNPSFNYLDSILRRYEKQGIKTVEQAKKSDKEFKKSQKEKHEQKRNYSRHPKSNQIGWRKHKESDYETEEELLRKLRGDYYGK